MAFFYAVYFTRLILVPTESDVSRYCFTITHHREMRPVGSAVRPFGEVSRAGNYFI
jgi:hypothetical protein